MAHRNEALLRKAYADFAQGDLEGYWSACRDDFTFHVPGTSQMAGSYQGKERFLEVIGKVMQLSGGALLKGDGVRCARERRARGRARGSSLCARWPAEGIPDRARLQHYGRQVGRVLGAPQDLVAFEDAWA